MSSNLIQINRGIASASDPYWSNVVLLMNMNGPTAQDVRGHPYAVHGTVSMSSAQSKFGGNSLFCNGAGYLTFDDSEDWNIGNGNFTLEAWVYQTNRTGVQGIMNQAQYGQYSDGSFDFDLSSGAGSGNVHGGAANNGNIQGSSPVALSTWAHVCYERNGDVFTIYQDGVVKAQGNAVVAGVTAINSTRVLAVGADTIGANIFQGYLGPLRFTKGVARYKGAFTPPTALFPEQ